MATFIYKCIYFVVKLYQISLIPDPTAAWP